MISRGFDLSNYSGVPTADQLAAAKALGFTWAILGTQRPTITRQQAAACAFAGIEVRGLYCFVYWNDGDYARVDQARILADALGLKVWMDYEWETEQNHVLGLEDAPTPDEQTLTLAMAGFHQQLGARLAGVYTGGWWWTKHMPTTALELPLWDAHYPYGQTAPPADYPHVIPSAGYGGWTAPAAWQYSSAGDKVVGFTCDLDAMEIVAPAPGPDSVLTLDELAYYKTLIDVGHEITRQAFQTGIAGVDLTHLADWQKQALRELALAAGPIPS